MSPDTTMMRGRVARPGPGRVVATAAFTLACSALPVFLLGALAPRISADLGVDEVAIGGLVAVFFLSGAICSFPGGVITDRIGSSAALRTGVALAATTAAAIALLAHSFWILLLLFVLAGASVPLADTGGARAISTGVPLRRQGLAFGGKEASIPIASLLAGMMVPILGAQLGWRPAYALAAALGVLVLIAVPGGLDRFGPGSSPLGVDRGGGRDRSVADATASAVPAAAPPSEGDERIHDGAPVRDDGAVVDAEPEPSLGDHRHGSPEPDRPAASTVVPVSARRALLLLAIASGLAGAAGNSAPTFLVSSSVATGVSESAAGILLASASVAGILSRLAAGATADRRGGSERRIMGGLMVVGAMGLAAIAVGGPGWTLVGALLAFGGGWGWTGLAFFAAVRLLPERPARAAGTILAGLASGGALGPLSFGALAAGPGYLVAWLCAAGAMLLAGLLVFQAERVAERGDD